MARPRPTSGHCSKARPDEAARIRPGSGTRPAGVESSNKRHGLNRTFAPLIAAAAMLSLAGCSSSPDAEFAIGDPAAAGRQVSASQAPLYIPPEYAVRPGTAPEEQPVAPMPQFDLSAGESNLLAMAGAAEANPSIRTLVDQESTTLAVVEPYRVERLVLGAAPTPPPGMVIERTDSRAVGNPLAQF